MPDKKYTLQIKWSDRDPITEEFAVNNKVSKVRDEAGKKFGIAATDLAQYKVLWDKGTGVQVPLPIDSKLADIEGLADGAVLILQAPNTPLG
jgi:hypothetical protein